MEPIYSASRSGEWEHIDILITCKQPPFVVAIENKIGAKEGPDQLSRYKKIVLQHHSQPALFVFLTLPDADGPTDDEWMSYSYSDIYDVFTQVRAKHCNAISPEVLLFLDHYLNLIGTRFMDNPEMDWRGASESTRSTGRRGPDLERVGSPPSGVLAEVAAVLAEDSRWEVVGRPSLCIDFVPKAWLEWLPPLGLKGDLRSWIHVDSLK